jgi:hypothetical protein
MGRKINTRNKNFLADLQARMKDRYNSIHNGTQYSEMDKQRAELIGVDLPEPVAPAIPERHGRGGYSSRRTPALDTFEAEYEAFIANLKAQKQAQENKVEVTNVPETNVETTQATEETPVVENKPKKTRKKKEVVETVQEKPVVEEQTESPVMEDDGQTEGEKSELPEFDLN